MKNKFFDPDTFPFEAHGFFEEFISLSNYKVLGCRNLTEPDRPLGSDGMKEVAITENMVLRKGMKEVLLRASPKRPVRALVIIQVLCGRRKEDFSYKERF